MLRRLPAGNRVVGHHERDDPGRVLGRRAPVGVRGLVDLGALDGPADRVVAEPAAARPVLVHPREHGAHHPDERLPAGEDPHDAAAAPELAVGALPHVVGAQPDVVLAGEIQVGRGVGLGLLRHLGRLGAEALYLGGGELAGLPHGLGVALGGHGLRDARHGALFPPGRRVAGGAAHQVHDAALPRGAREDLLDRALEALVGVAGDAGRAVDPACARRQRERPPAAVGPGADGGDRRGRPHAARVPACF